MRNSPEENPDLALKDAPLSGGPVLALPDAPDFISRPPWVPPDVMLDYSETLLPLVNSRPEAAEQRLKEKCRVPFEL